MKLFYTISLLIAFFNCCLANVWNGDYFIHNQNQANQFKSIIINGDLYIQGGNTTHLDSLHRLEIVNGSIYIFFTENLENIDGLNNLKFVDELSINENQNLKIIKGFERLITVNERIDISRNALVQINGFNKLTNVNSIEISNTATLKEITGFNAMDSLHRLEIRSDINKIDAFHNLKKITSGFTFYLNLINKFAAFEALTEVRGRFNLFANLSSKQLEVFDKLHKVGSFNFRNSTIEELSAFNNLISVNLLSIYGCVSLKNMAGFKNLKQINTLEIFGNAQLTSILPFHKFRHIDRIYISRNANLLSLDAFSNLKSAHYIAVARNNNLLELTDFNQASRVDSIYIENRNLRNLDAFRKLTSIGKLTLFDNIQLKSMNNFAELSQVSKQIVLQNNLQLNQCCIVNCWLNNGVLTESQLELDLNAETCSTIESIKTNCIDFEECLKIKDELTDLNILVNPPIDESLSFCFIATVSQNITYTIYNLNGQQLQKGGLVTETGLNNKTITLEPTMLKGYYFLSIDNEHSLQSARFLKL